MKKLLFTLIAAVLALPVAAQQKPLIFVAQETISYDDNIYLTKNDEKDSFISTTRVGADYNANIPATSLRLNASALVGYNAYTEKPSKNNYWDALGKLELSNKQFKVGDSILYTSDPANNALTDREKRLNNNAYISYVTSTEKMFGVGVEVSDEYNHYYSGKMKFLNRNRLNAGAQLYYNMTANTNFFVEYMFSDISYKDNKTNESQSNLVGLGVKGQIAPKVTGIAKITYDMRDYDHSWGDAKNHPDLLGYFAQLEWKPTTRNVIRLSGERRLEETYWDYNRYFKDTNVSLYASHKLSNKWLAAVTLMWDKMDYDHRAADGTKRSDDLYSIRPEVNYAFKDWLTAGVWYQYRTRTSNLKAAEYDNNKAGVFVKAVF